MSQWPRISDRRLLSTGRQRPPTRLNCSGPLQCSLDALMLRLDRRLQRSTMAVLQVFQAKLLSSMEESERYPPTLRELRSATDLALPTTKTSVQVIGKSMASLVVPECHLWFTLMEIKDADKVPSLMPRF